ncbi:hypothetical protein ACFL0Z_02140 [Patescibacteria group bacterium]
MQLYVEVEEEQVETIKKLKEAGIPFEITRLETSEDPDFKLQNSLFRIPSKFWHHPGLEELKTKLANLSSLIY